ncbi:hypothetical protein niasHT_011582 [Heterodera trifolii]|uniref:Uncharacterized protein n=1 Tax=Heterodera trifolii TaxID=157864 RepID=A0ABD2L842_9BILA
MFCQAFASGIGGFKKGFLSSVYGTTKNGKGKSVEQSGSQTSSKLIENTTTNIASAQQEKENVRIRVIYRNDDSRAEHASVVVGFYEYDFIRKGARRRKFRSEIDRELDEFDAKKDRPFKGDGLFVEKGKADQVFFEMSGRFWFDENYSYNWANSLEMFDHQNCELKDHRLEILIKNCVFNGEKCANLLFFHLTGRFDGPIENREQLKNPILVQTKPEKEWQNAKNDATIHLSVVLKAYSCKTGARKLPKTFVTDLFLVDETVTKWLKMKNVCHFHNFNAVNLDELTDHIMEFEFVSWAKLK